MRKHSSQRLPRWIQGNLPSPPDEVRTDPVKAGRRRAETTPSGLGQRLRRKPEAPGESRWLWGVDGVVHAQATQTPSEAWCSFARGFVLVPATEQVRSPSPFIPEALLFRQRDRRHRMTGGLVYGESRQATARKKGP
jgi:hypothetical protein